MILTAPANTVSAAPDKKLHSQCIYPTVLIKVGTSSFGSGVIVRSEKVGDEYRNVVLTCGHIFLMSLVNNSGRDCEVGVGQYKDWSTFEGYEMYAAKRYGMEKDMDLGVVVFVSKEKMPVGKLNFRKRLYIGNDVFHVGCGLGDEIRIDYGKVTSVKAEIRGILDNAIRTSVFTVPGDSGGPLFEDYEVVGIAQAIRNVRLGWNVYPTFKISLYIPVSRLKKWDADVNTLGFVYKDEPMPVLPFLRMEIDTYKPVIEAVPTTIWDNK